MASGRLVVTIREGETIRVEKPTHELRIRCDEVRSRSGVWVSLYDAEVEIPEAFVALDSEISLIGVKLSCLDARSRKARIAITASKEWRITRDENDRE